MDKNEVRRVLEAVLFIAGDAVDCEDLVELLEFSKNEFDEVVERIALDQQSEGAALLLRRVGDKLQLCTNPLYSEYIKKLFATEEKSALSRSMLETLSIIAYKQPITRQEIDAIRGVRSNYTVAALMEKDLIRVVGRKDALGRPQVLGTTDEFLRRFGIEGLRDLPDIEAFEQTDFEEEDGGDRFGGY